MNRKTIIIKGVCLTLGILVLLVGITTFQALLNPEPVNYLSTYFRFFALFSLAAGGFYAGLKDRRKSWLSGASVGFITSLLSLICSVLFFPKVFTVLDLFDTLVPGTVLAGMAGVCGGNIARVQKSQSQAARVKRKTQL